MVKKNHQDKEKLGSEKLLSQKLRDPYESGLVKVPNFIGRSGLRAQVVAILTELRENRGLKLIYPPTRCFKRYEVHELLLTDEMDAAPGGTVNRTAGIAFIEFINGGVMIRGDKVKVNNSELGEIVGFDDTHMPNHYNIVIKRSERITGQKWGLKSGEELVITPPH